MLIVSVMCIVLLVASTIIHYETLRGLSYSLPRLQMPPRTKLVLVILGAFVGHSLEIFMYAGAYHWLAWEHGMGTINGLHQPTLLMCLYLSATTYSSLGYGDIVPEGTLRLLASTEVLIGLILIGWTAAYIYISMERFWEDGAKRRHKA